MSVDFLAYAVKLVLHLLYFTLLYFTLCSLRRFCCINVSFGVVYGYGNPVKGRNFDMSIIFLFFAFFLIGFNSSEK